MTSIKSLLIIGFVFLTNGITFLVVGLATNLTVFWSLGPAFITLGVVFLAIAKSRRTTPGDPSSSSSTEA